MNDLAPIGRSELPARAGEPTLPPSLATQVAALMSGGYGGLSENDPGFAFHRQPTHDPNAARFIAEYDHLCRPADPAVVRLWLSRLAVVTPNRPAREDFAMVACEMAEALLDLPASVWTSETLAEAKRAFRFWPSVAELDALLRPKADALRGKRDALHAIHASRVSNWRAREAQPQPPRQPPTPEELARVRETVASLVRDQPSKREPIRVEPRYLAPDQLAAAYRKLAEQGSRAAATRLAMLEGEQ